MPIAHQVRLVKNGITYVYESTSYWDSEKKQPCSKRRLIGISIRKQENWFQIADMMRMRSMPAPTR